MNAHPILEIAIQDAAGARLASQAGASRVEVCSALGVGGLTPSLGLIESCVAVGIETAVLIRPRPGDFIYDDAEARLAARDIALAVRGGAHAVVVGALTGPDQLAADMLRGWIDAARAERAGVQIVLHRCVDVLLAGGVTSAELLDQVAALGGINRILTSGGAPTCAAGAETLAELVRLADAGKGADTRKGADAGSVEIMAGGGLQPGVIPSLAARGIRSFHLSARRTVSGGPAGPGGGPASYEVPAPAQVEAAVAAQRAARPAVRTATPSSARRFRKARSEV